MNKPVRESDRIQSKESKAVSRDERAESGVMCDVSTAPPERRQDRHESNGVVILLWIFLFFIFFNFLKFC